MPFKIVCRGGGNIQILVVNNGKVKKGAFCGWWIKNQRGIAGRKRTTDQQYTRQANDGFLREENCFYRPEERL